MSLPDLIQRYAADTSIEGRLGILEAIGQHLPAPAFLWYDVAREALASEETVLRAAALPLLAHAPQGWDAVVVAALTASAPGFQAAALHTLACQVDKQPELAPAYDALGALPGWTAPALEAWEALRPEAPASAPSIAQLMGEPDPLPFAGRSDAAAQQAREALARVEAERERLASALGEAERRGAELDARLAELQGEKTEWEGRLQALDTRLAEQREAAKQEQAELSADHRSFTRGLQHEIAALHTRQDRWFKVAAVALLVVGAAGLGGGWALGSRATLEAREPLPGGSEVPPAGTAEAAAPGFSPSEESAASRAAAESLGYDRALDALARHARALGSQGALYPALRAWESYVKIAPSREAAALGKREAAAIAARIRHEANAAQEGGHPGAPKRPAGAPARPRAAEAAAAPAEAPAATAPAATPLPDAIPDTVRSKF